MSQGRDKIFGELTGWTDNTHHTQLGTVTRTLMRYRNKLEHPDEGSRRGIEHPEEGFNKVTGVIKLPDRA